MTTLLRIVLSGALLAMVAAPASATPQVGSPPPAENAATAESQPLASVDLPVSLERIRRQLRELPESTESNLRLSYYIEVYGRAPAVDLFGGFDLHTGPVPYGGPTHAEFLDVVTPQPFRTPAVDLLAPTKALFDWLMRGRQDGRE